MTVSLRDLCIDAHDVEPIEMFWAGALGLVADGTGPERSLVGGSIPRIWVNEVSEPKTVKNRVHLDVYGDVGAFAALGATLYDDQGVFQVMADPEGNEFCVFAPPPGHPPIDAAGAAFAMCVDSAHPVELAAWWHNLLGGQLGPGPDGRLRWNKGPNGWPDMTMKAVLVDDERAVKNRVHWDVDVDDIDELTSAGASILRQPDHDIGWTIMADPDGNEFCAFGRVA